MMGAATDIRVNLEAVLLDAAERCAERAADGAGLSEAQAAEVLVRAYRELWGMERVANGC